MRVQANSYPQLEANLIFIPVFTPDNRILIAFRTALCSVCGNDSCLGTTKPYAPALLPQPPSLDTNFLKLGMTMGLTSANEIWVEFSPVISDWRHVRSGAQYSILSLPVSKMKEK